MAISDEELLAKYPRIPIDHDSKEYWRGCLQKKLLVSRCQDCGNWIHNPRPMCPRCWSENVVPTEVSGKGTVYLFTLYHQGADPTIDYSHPYPQVAVELEEEARLRITSTVVNCSSEDLYVGMPVELTWIDFQGAPVPVFQPAPGAKKG